MTPPLRIANASGFLGDRFPAPREMVEGGPIDVLTGDYLAEVTMAILTRRRASGGHGYAEVFLRQLEEVLVPCRQRGVRIVVNAGGLAPAALGQAVGELAHRLGVAVKVGVVDGDDVLGRDGAQDHAPTPAQTWARPPGGARVVAANAYLGAGGIAEALTRGCDVVVTGRVTDPSLVVGPAMWHHGWSATDWDALAGATVAGHLIECGAQVTGGNFSFFDEIGGLGRPGFPIAEVASDGSAVITKHPGTGGAVTAETVTAQLLYEIGGPDYMGPDVIARLDTVSLDETGPDRVRVHGVAGSPPPPTAKVGVVVADGYRNDVSFVLAGLDIEAKAQLVLDGLWALAGAPDRYDDVSVELRRTDQRDPPTNPAALATLTVAVSSRDEDLVGRAFSDAAVQLALASVPGLTFTSPPRGASPRLRFRTGSMDRRDLVERVTIGDDVVERACGPSVDGEARAGRTPSGSPEARTGRTTWGDTVPVPIGRIVGARSGDKGADANLGVWARTDAAYEWLEAYLTVERLRILLPDLRSREVERHRLPRVRALNFVLRDELGDEVLSSARFDPQAKTLAEFFRARVVDVPEVLLAV